VRVAFCAWYGTVKVSMWRSELHGSKTNIEGFERKTNDITEDTVIDLDGVHEEGDVCVNPWPVCRKIGLQ